MNYTCQLCWLLAGELDFQADEAFLEALVAFVLSIPTADIWQDASWDARQRRLLTAQFGPQEVRDLTINRPLLHLLSIHCPGGACATYDLP